MKCLKYLFLAALTVTFLSIGGAVAQAQSDSGYAKARKAFKEGRQLAKNKKYSQSVSKLKKSIDLAKGGGDKSAQIAKLAKNLLPQIYFKEAMDSYQAFQKSQSTANLDKAIQAFKDAVDAGKQYGAESVVKHSNQAILQLMYEKASMQYNDKNYDDALATINKVLDQNANYARAYYQKALILKKQNKMDDAYAAFDKAIQAGKKANKSQVVRRAKENAAEGLISSGANAVKNKHYNTGIKMFKHALKYNPQSSKAYYRLANAYNAKGSYSEALSNAKKGLKYASGGRATKAKFYYEEGKAYQGLDKKSAACKALTNAEYGKFKSSAHHKMKYELKCSE
jgi:tetratricopeptide (TPR) repeat protein